MKKVTAVNKLEKERDKQIEDDQEGGTVWLS